MSPCGGTLTGWVGVCNEFLFPKIRPMCARKTTQETKKRRDLKELYKAGYLTYPTFGSNCWGATLFLKDVLNGPRWIERENMTLWLNENTIPVWKEERKVGDIICWFNRKKELMHTALLEILELDLKQDLLFHKQGQFAPKYQRTWEVDERNKGCLAAYYRYTAAMLTRKKKRLVGISRLNQFSLGE